MCLHYINMKLLTVPSQYYGSCTIVSLVVSYAFLLDINTRAKTNKITLRQFTASQSTCRHLQYLTHRHTFRHGVSGSTVTVTEEKTMCVLAKLIGSTGNVRIISRTVGILCQGTKNSVSDPVILFEMP